MKSYRYYNADYRVSHNDTPAGRYVAQKATKRGAVTRAFDADWVWDGVDDENEKKRTLARRHVLSLFRD